MKPAGKFVLALLILGVIIGGLMFARSKRDLIAPKGHIAGSGDVPKGSFDSGKVKKSDKVRIIVVTWGGYAGGQLYNKGFNYNKTSRFFTELGIQVEFKIMDNFEPSRNAFREEGDLMWATVDAFPTEAEALFKQMNGVTILYQADWSYGGDNFIVGPGIESAADLIGKKVAFAEMTPSHTMLLFVLDASDLQMTDIEPVIVSDAIEAAKYYKEGKVDAAVVWSPDDDDCINARPGSKSLMNTREAPNIIADIFIAKTAWVQTNPEVAKKIMKGFFVGAAEIHSSKEAKEEAARILDDGFGKDFDYNFALNAIDKARQCTYQDNVNFFGLNTSYTGMTGKRLYERMTKVYRSINYVRGDVPTWEQLTEYSIPLIKSLQSELGNDANQAPQEKTVYSKPTNQEYTKKAVTTKAVRVTFATGSAALDENAKTIVDLKFGDILLASANRIRIEGNTDNTGSRQTNITLSQARGNSCRQYLIEKYGIDGNRIIVIGNGPDNPVADNDTPVGKAKNRRVDFMLLGD